MHQRLGKDILGFFQRQALGGTQQPFAPFAVQADLDLGLFLHVFDDPVQQSAEIDQLGKPNSTTVTSFEARGPSASRRDDHDRLVRVAQATRHVAQSANHGQVRPVLVHEVMKVLEQKDRRLDVVQHRVERRQGIGRAAGPPLAALRFGSVLGQPLVSVQI